jgi:ABC-type phosphate transport system auxiliary subunit
VKRRDLRRIYCRTVQSLDTSERDNAIRERDLERNARRKLEYEKNELQLSYDALKEQFKRLQTEHDRLLKYIVSLQCESLVTVFVQVLNYEGIVVQITTSYRFIHC